MAGDIIGDKEIGALFSEPGVPPGELLEERGGLGDLCADDGELPAATPGEGVCAIFDEDLGEGFLGRDGNDFCAAGFASCAELAATVFVEEFGFKIVQACCCCILLVLFTLLYCSDAACCCCMLLVPFILLYCSDAVGTKPRGYDAAD